MVDSERSTPPPRTIKPKLTPSIPDTLTNCIAGRLSVAQGQSITLTTRSNKRESFGREETHPVKVIRLKPADRIILKSMASRYGVKSLRYFIEGLLLALDDHGDGSQVLLRVYD